MLRVAVFVSGRGSNLKAILTHTDLANLIKVIAVFSDKSDCAAFEIAKSFGIETKVIGKGENKIDTADLLSVLKSYNLDLIVLAGYLKLIPLDVVKHFENRIINIHPALLPSFGGKGMYGMNVHNAVFNSSAKVSGATVHFVDPEYDRGKIIAQRCVDISDVKSPEEIAERVLKIEHQLLPEVIKAFAENKIKIEDNRVVIKS
ncbi:phosphoribosylglycinamide formyltransferase [Ignavibacterium sp.]|uniref:phosphoribosylglycinamide formyltransferase n=1 Tax=Ignavibacterium sp. TaxID=2651167 RepID=UPI0022082EAF|nr:phosphoribosylglycinamide formyltransferase [Ignavibacterium sp.]BDQ02203.1 MAG: phosphoribosylglycinamide formyltransferase [Ignavibacterium sp.]